MPNNNAPLARKHSRRNAAQERGVDLRPSTPRDRDVQNREELARASTAPAPRMPHDAAKLKR